MRHWGYYQSLRTIFIAWVPKLHCGRMYQWSGWAHVPSVLLIWLSCSCPSLTSAPPCGVTRASYSRRLHFLDAQEWWSLGAPADSYCCKLLRRYEKACISWRESLCKRNVTFAFMWITFDRLSVGLLPVWIYFAVMISVDATFCFVPFKKLLICFCVCVFLPQCTLRDRMTHLTEDAVDQWRQLCLLTPFLLDFTGHLLVPDRGRCYPLARQKFSSTVLWKSASPQLEVKRHGRWKRTAAVAKKLCCGGLNAKQMVSKSHQDASST